jgi:enoyl-CoA hydratase/carnithine racemase
MQINQLGAVRQITLDRPERRNALGTELIQQLEEALDAAEHDASVCAVVLSAAPPAFCAGSDLKELGALSVTQMCEHERETARVARGIAALSKPVIASVEGYALGGGFILAISCDVVVTATNARWHLPEVSNGWLPPWGLQALLVRVGPVKARFLTWGFDPIDGTEAHRIGVADYVAAPGAVDDLSLSLGARMAALPAPSVRSCKRFYEPFVTLDGERLDRQATEHFAANCQAPIARATLEKFKVKK